MNSGGSVQILLVEDNPGDVRLTQEAFRHGRLANELIVCGDGVAAMALLRERQAKNEQQPGLILLDLNLPGRGGLEVLAEIKADTELRVIPVVILTSSGAERDVLQSYERNANAYVTKPIDIDEFLAAIRSLGDFWLAVVQLPRP
ncbi:MAG TPA: response regulator [Candidatus Limnocylindrales bacterium]|jgi:CheY-like chemotaxis protein